MIKRFKIVLVLFFLVSGVWCLYGCKGGCPFIKRDKPVQPSASSEEKFSEIARWVPENANVIIAIDIYRVAQSELWNNTIKTKLPALWNYFKIEGLDFKSDIGMLTILMDISHPENIKGPLGIIQGGFNQDLLISRAKNLASKENINFSKEIYKDFAIYSEKVSQTIPQLNQAFAPIGNGLIAMGQPKDLKWLIDNSQKKKQNALVKDVSWATPIWGKAASTKELSSPLPKPWNQISAIYLNAAIANDMNMKIVLSLYEESESTTIKNALEGFLVIEALSWLDNETLLNAIEKISITTTGNSVTIDIPEELNLLKMITKQNLPETEIETDPSDKEEDEPE